MMLDSYNRPINIGNVVIVTSRGGHAALGRVIRFTAKKVEVRYYYDLDKPGTGYTILKDPYGVIVIDDHPKVP